MQQHSLILSLLRNRLLACIAAAGVSLGASGTTLGGDCGCLFGCHLCAVVDDDCACECRTPKKHNCVYRVLDAFAGGVEKLLCLDGCDCDTNERDRYVCDDACDVRMMDELMLPSAPDYLAPAWPAVPELHGAPLSVPVPPAYDGPNHDVQINPTGPNQWQAPRSEIRMTEPSIEPKPSAGQDLDVGEILPEPETPAAPPPGRTRPQPIPEPRGEFDPLFDSLSDPFSDDEVNLNTRRHIHLGSNDDARKQPNDNRNRKSSRSYATSQRRPRSIR